MSARIELLGSFRLLVAGEERRVASRKARILLARLALARGRPVSREALAALLWEDSDEEQARVSLRQALKQLRRALEPLEAALLSVDDALALDTAAIAVDVLELERAAGNPATAAEALPLLEGDLLQSHPAPEAAVEEWLAVERQRIRNLASGVLDASVEAAAATHELARASELVLRALRLEPLRESLHRRLMQLYAMRGEPARAIKQFQICRDVLQRELGVRPEPETVALFEAIRARRLAARESDPAFAARAGAPDLDPAGNGKTDRSGLDADTPPIHQDIRFCRTRDGVTLAYAISGSGPPLVKAANWLSHLEYEWESPVWRHWIEGLCARHTLIRYDERSNGLSERDVEDLSFRAMVADLEAVVDAAGLDRFVLVGLSQGCAISVAYAHHHPERVEGLVLYGGYVRGWRARGDPHEIAKRSALATLIKEGWGQDVPAFRQVFASLFIPGASHEQMDWFNELQRISVSPENAVRLTDAFGDIDVSDCLPGIVAPTLVLHARDDLVCPISGGRALAAGIPGARLVTLESANHILLADEPAFATFLHEIETFCESLSRPASSAALPTAGIATGSGDGALDTML